MIGFNIVGDDFVTNEFPSIRLSDLKLEIVSEGVSVGVEVEGNGAALTIDAMRMHILTSAGGQGYVSVDMNTTISNSTIIVEGDGGDLSGITRIANAGDGFSLLSTNVQLSSEGPVGIGSVGVENLGGGSGLRQPMIVRDSRIRADTSIRAQGIPSGNRTYVSDSIILGNVLGEPFCDFVFTTIGQRLDNNCGVPESQ